MNRLTKAEEQVMQIVWSLKEAMVKDVVDKFDDPKPAYTTVATVLRMLNKKGFVGQFFVNNQPSNCRNYEASQYKDCPILIIIWISGIILFSCSSEDYSSSIDLSKNHAISVFDVFSDINVIQLETSEDFLINQIHRIEYYDDRYYIIDGISQQILCFDKRGQFVFKINSQGKGPGEYHYITDISIDRNNNQLVVLDPVVQRVHFFDLEGEFISSRNIKDDKVLGLARVYPIDDSLLLLISATYENLLFYSLKEDKIVYADFAYDVPSTLGSLSPDDNVYYFDDQIFFLVPLSRMVTDVTTMYPEPYFTWCFGPDNNSDQQINHLLKEIRQQKKYYVPSLAVGKNKILHHHILKSFENERFRIAAVEFDDDFIKRYLTN